MTETIKHILGTCGESHFNIYHIIFFSIVFLATVKYKLTKRNE